LLKGKQAIFYWFCILIFRQFFAISRILFCVVLMFAWAFMAMPRAQAAMEQERGQAGGEQAQRELRQVLFAGYDLVRGELSFTGGFKRHLSGGIDQSGPIIMGFTGATLKQERFDTGFGVSFMQPRFTRYSALLFGRQWIGDAGIVKFAAGPEFTNEQQLDQYGIPRWGRDRVGLRLLTEIWAEPSPGLLATGTLIFSSGQGSLWGRGALGREVGSRIFVGPEASFYLENEYSEAKLGLHVTGLRIWRFNFRLNGGAAFTPGSGPGGYAGISGHIGL